MNWIPKTRNRLGLTPFDWKPPSDIDAYNGVPFRPYPHYERIAPRDLVQMLENDCRLLWKECAPCEVPEEFQGLKTIAHDELWDDPINIDSRNRGYLLDAPQTIKARPSKKIDTQHYEYTEDDFLGISSEEKEIRKAFYPGKKFT